MVEPALGGVMAHKPSVKFKSEHIPHTNPDEWSAKLRDGVVVSVHGPCPQCGGPAFGPRLRELPPEDLTSSLNLVDLAAQARGTLRQVDVRAECRCDTSHGKSGALSCGRDWFVRVEWEE